MGTPNFGGSPSQLVSNRYRILGVLGEGGFGKTFLVEDTQMPSARRCVLKQLKPIHDNPQIHQLVKERFQREAAILERLGDHHRQIPRLYAYFEEGDEFYLVEEWVEGETLAQRVEIQGVMSETEVRSLLLDLLPLLSDIHRQGIVHRDIKPDNIILRRLDRKPVLIDFGAVKETMSTLLNSQGGQSQSIVIGTPGYMSSEQMAGRPVFSSDLYSLGLTAIYLLTGRQPQQLDNDPMTGKVLWQQYVPNLSPDFAAVLDRAIQPYANQRFAAAQDMAMALSSGAVPPSTVIASEFRIDSSQTVPSAPTPSTQASVVTRSPWTWQWAIIGMGAASLAGIAGLLAYFTMRPTPTPIASTSPIKNTIASPKSSPVDPSPAPKEPTTSAPAPVPQQPAKPPEQPAKPVEPPIDQACRLQTGTTLRAQTLTLDTCSIDASNPSLIRFIYYLNADRVQAQTDCASGTWTSFPENQVNRPQSPATEKMLERICGAKSPQGAASNDSISKAGVATVFNPPSNVRVSPNGAILCSVREKRNINVYDLKGDWYTTDVCGTSGVIHRGQLKF
ncbi:serine/threonine-protein kinase [Leptolyngbya sp. NIES-2104]|uniref:serine/threonine-protein kinase n=1 Tax=Leptolyngbya sp. NIES-2104 TaxID=1552121 RepID=UPI00073F2E09|nr:serine/threonine-protein kinase [Leptolyngbya sp. NIES-2104]